MPSVIIPGFGKHEITFNRDNFVYKEKTHNYGAVTGIYYNSVKTSVNFIPIGQSYAAGIILGREKINIGFSSAFYLGNKNMEAAYYELVAYMRQFIESRLVAGMIKDIFDSGKTVNINGFEFSKEGYRKKKMFGGFDTVLWTDKVYIPQMDMGYVYVYRDKKDRPVVFKTIYMQSVNSVILPGLVQACYDRYHGIQPA